MGRGWGKAGINAKAQLQLGLGLAELGNIVFVVLVIVLKFVWWWMGGWCKVIFMSNPTFELRLRLVFDNNNSWANIDLIMVVPNG